MKFDLILIDVDGTMVDSVPDLCYCIDRMQEQLNNPIRGEEKVRKWVGNGVEKLVQRALWNELEPKNEHPKFKQAMDIFNNLYKDNVSKRSVLYPGVKNALCYLTDKGYKLACVTNKASRFTVPLLKNLQVDEFFSKILCGDELKNKKPHPEPLLYLAKKLKCSPQKSLLIGDSQSDVKAARAANFSIYCVSYGYNHGEDINTYNPDLIFDSFADMREIL
jgi:phosphoglycolate phosphatase